MLFREIHHMVKLHVLGFLLHHCQVTIYFLSEIILHLNPLRLSFKTPMGSIPVYWLVAVVVTARSRSTPFSDDKNKMRPVFISTSHLRCSSCHSSLRVIYVVCHSTFLLRSSKPYITKISIMCIGHSVTLISVRSASSVKSITTGPFGGVGGQTCRMVECGPTVALTGR